MKPFFYIAFFLFSNLAFSQSIDALFPQKKMQKDLAIFKDLRKKANSGLYKYRTEKQIDSIYSWAEKEIKNLSTYRDFYTLISQLTNFEGSLHNDTWLPEKVIENLRKEQSGYFPFPIKWIEGKWLVNFENEEIPLGAEIIAINKIPIAEIISNLAKYYTTDGDNLTGKKIGIRTHFAKYFRLQYGLKDQFIVGYIMPNAEEIVTKTISSISYKDYYTNFQNRFSKAYDQIYYADLADNQKYNFKKLDSLTAKLTIYSFNIGDEKSKEHAEYVKFLDSVFIQIKKDNIKNLIVDVRQNGGGTDPNDLVTYSYLTQRNFQENKKAWISFRKIPLLKYYNSKAPKFIRPFFVGKFNKEFQEIFPVEDNNRFYQNESSNDHRIWTPNPNAFKGKIYLLVSPAVASAGSLFASMVAGNESTITVGEETMGGYYGHNGHTPLEYKLPKSKIVTQFSVVNLEQDVPKKENQMKNRGIIPDYYVVQTYQDYLNQTDTQLNFVYDLIKKN
ncbi:S41 family peptidase [Flavobacterium soli]|uniref:S41 family peptidase n=1 Tax=Flavobacterium soli TaxID=344881 RepID=UPI0004295624|nr:S41 family peptidase [Flavobacterium soli]